MADDDSFSLFLMIETTDIVFAVDSITAVFAITQDSFIIYTSNIFAVLGLRDLYFVLFNSFNKLRYFKIGLGLILGFTGLKILIEPFMISLFWPLAVIITILAATILFSLRRAKKI